MNEPMSKQANTYTPTYTPTDAPPGPPGGADGEKTIDAALWLRWLGSFAVVSSAIVYMLEGIHTSGEELRNWMYLAAMGLMAMGGLISGKFLQDSKGARVFFGLAMLLVPVQFSQIAGQIHEAMVVAGPNSSLVSWLGTAVSQLTLPLLATTLLSVPIAYAGATVLARRDRKLVFSALLTLCACLLIPARDSLLGYIIIICLLGATSWLKSRLFDQQTIYNNLDGVGLRVILASPMVIGFVRLLTHVDGVESWAAIAGLSAIAITRNSAASAQGNLTRFVGAILGIVSWWVYLNTGALFDSAHFSLYFLPVAIWLMDIGRLAAPNGRDYRITAMGFVFASAVSFLISNDIYGANFYALAHGLVALTWGVLNNQREPALIGAPLALISLIAISADALSGFQFNGWIGLGGLGLALVFGASLLERFGSDWLNRGRNAWKSMDDWQESA